MIFCLGLLHDVGHGPFSHMFEGKFLSRVFNGDKWSHKKMSAKMIDYMVDEHNIDIDPELLKKVKGLCISLKVKYALLFLFTVLFSSFSL
ncbi:uncharacterized protein [Arachis hypogaea]|uniref:uncharacterized protein n=1 Tax=Arachis hypogaea TaxID=3818 RepID=UPI0007AF09F9